MSKDNARRKELLRRHKERQVADARARLCLDREQLRDLLDYLALHVKPVGTAAGGGALVRGCDHTLRHTRAWAGSRQLDAERVAESVGAFGGYCDCEVLFNVRPHLFGW